MKKLKTYYIGLMCACMSGVLTTACTDNDHDVAVKKTDILLSISVKQLHNQTRAEMPNAAEPGKELTPIVKRIWGIFCDHGTVVHSEVKDLSGNIAQFDKIPTSADKLYVVGYPESTSTSPEKITIVTENELKKKIMIDMQSQSPTNPTLVNTYGAMTISLSDLKEGDEITINMDLSPAMSRLEIQQIGSTVSSRTIERPILSFKLDGIYINNTYTKLGLDGVTRPTAADSILNYGSAATVWANPATYPARFCDNFKYPAAQSSFAAGTGKSWGYYIVPLSSANGAKGTTINGELRPEVVPHIVLKVSDISVEVGQVIPTPMYLTVRGYKQPDGTPVTQFDAGSVYYIKNLTFGLEDLSIEPEADPSDITVTLTVLDWVDELIAGGVD
jgi:hypothetical protein